MSARDPKEPVSVRLPADLVAALRQKAKDDDCSLSDVLRRGALGLLGICPTCERPIPGPEGQPSTSQGDR